MPKALTKPKHGRKTGAAQQVLSESRTSVPGPSQDNSRDTATIIKDSHAHHKPRKLTSSSSKDERLRDRALKKICNKASSHLSSSARAKEGIRPSGTEIPIERPPAVTPDQMSLRDCPVAIPTSGLWGSVEAAVPAPMVTCPVAPESLAGPPPPSAHDSRETVPPQVPVCQHLLPEHFQDMITAAIQRTLSAGFLPPNRDTSVRSCASTSPDRDYQDDSLSIGAPDSPAASHASRPSLLGEIKSREPDLSDDEGLPPEKEIS